MLYLYFAANKDNYSFALSPVAVKNEIGMARSTYNDQFHRLVEKGYLVNRSGNTYDFYEVPQPGSRTPKASPASGSVNPAEGQQQPPPAKDSPQEVIEINNSCGTTTEINSKRVEQAPHDPEERESKRENVLEGCTGANGEFVF